MYVKSQRNNKLTHSLIHHFESVPNSRNLQTTTEMWLFEDFKTQTELKTSWKKVKLLNLSNFTFCHNVFPKAFFSSVCYVEERLMRQWLKLAFPM